MANTQPVQDTAGVVEQVEALGRRHGYATVRPIGAVTVGLKGERLAEIGAMAASRAKVRVFSDDGNCVHDPLLMRRALEYVTTFDGVVAQHAQDPRLTVGAQMNEGEVSARLGLAGWPAVAEESIIARDVLLAEHVGARLHVCHVSTAGAVEVIRWAKARGIRVTAEATPHHLLLTEDLAVGYDPRYKVNPPLRSTEDVEALRAGLADGTIDIVATDHAPHPPEAKECAWAEAANGHGRARVRALRRPRRDGRDRAPRLVRRRAGHVAHACQDRRAPRLRRGVRGRRARALSRSTTRPNRPSSRSSSSTDAAATRRTSGAGCPDGSSMCSTAGSRPSRTANCGPPTKSRHSGRVRRSRISRPANGVSV